jgi:hypothetical protein
MYREYRPYVPVAVRQRQAEHELAKLRKEEHAMSPVLMDDVEERER